MECQSKGFDHDPSVRKVDGLDPGFSSDEFCF